MPSYWFSLNDRIVWVVNKLIMIYNKTIVRSFCSFFFRTRPREHIAYLNYSLVLNKFSRVDFLLKRFSSFYFYVYMFCSSSNIQTFFFEEFFLYLFLCKNQLKPLHCSPILFYSLGGGVNLNEFESILHRDASMQVSAIPTD